MILFTEYAIRRWLPAFTKTVVRLLAREDHAAPDVRTGRRTIGRVAAPAMQARAAYALAFEYGGIVRPHIHVRYPVLT